MQDSFDCKLRVFVHISQSQLKDYSMNTTHTMPLLLVKSVINQALMHSHTFTLHSGDSAIAKAESPVCNLNFEIQNDLDIATFTVLFYSDEGSLSMHPTRLGNRLIMNETSVSCRCRSILSKLNLTA